MRGMQRSAGVTVIAILSLLGSLLCLAMSCLMVLALFVSPAHQSLDDPAARYAKIGFIFAIIFFLGPAVWGITTSIGLFRLRRWARISTLIFSGLLAFFGVLSSPFILVVHIPDTPGANPAVMSGIKIFMVVFYLTLAAIGIWWLIYLTRPAVKAQFEVGFVPGPPPRRPLSISIIGWLLIICGCFLPLNLLLHSPIIVLGIVLTGWAATLLFIAFGAVSLVAGIGLLRLRNYARLLAIAYLAFGVLNSIVSFVLPGGNARFARMIAAMPSFLQAPNPPAINIALMSAVMIPVWLIPFYFLIKHKSAFDERNSPPSSPIGPGAPN